MTDSKSLAVLTRCGKCLEEKEMKEHGCWWPRLLASATLLPGVWIYESMEEHVVRESETVPTADSAGWSLGCVKAGQTP